MRVSNKLMADTVKANLDKLATQIMKTEIKLATGKKINNLSDDPVGISNVLDYRKTISTIDQYQDNINSGKTRIEFTETVLEKTSDLIRQAINIASNPNTENKDALATEISNIRDQILDYANSKLGGTYLFSGNATTTQPFATNGTYNGSTGQKSIIIGDSVNVQLEADGRNLFTDGTDNVFDVLTNLETALNANNMTNIKAQIAPLVSIDDNLENKRSAMASTYKRMETAENHWAGFKVNMQNILSRTEDADIAKAAVDLQIQQNNYEIALATSAKIIQPTLLDFLR